MASVLGPNSSYWSPAQVRLFINGHHVDDACALQYTVRDNKQPKWGYNDRNYSAVAIGRTLVEGQVSIEYRHNNYLMAVMNEIITQRRKADIGIRSSQDEPVDQTQWVSQFREIFLRLNNNRDAIAAWLTTLARTDRARFKAAKAFFDAAFGSVPMDGMDIAILQSGEQLVGARKAAFAAISAGDLALAIELSGTTRPSLSKTDIAITIEYGGAFEDTVEAAVDERTKTIAGIQFIGEGQRIEITPPHGATSIREVYQFFAKDLMQGAWCSC
jgi:hypothetical protein